MATLALLSGCDDLGSCDEPKARELVVTPEGTVLYAGQAIMNASCANGRCHTSQAAGAARAGAPFGLDFELRPARAAAPGGDDSVTSGELTLSKEGVAQLRKNQRKVFDQRDEIWEQVQSGLMPPRGEGSAERAASGGTRLEPGNGCTLSEALGSFGESKEIFRNWLACGSPVVEASDAAIDESTIVRRDDADEMMSQPPLGVPGTVGQQMPSCLDEDACDEPRTFEQLYADVFVPSCVSCHQPGGLAPEFDLLTVENAWAALRPNEATAGAEACNDAAARAVVPGSPEDSYIIVKMGGAGSLTLCGEPMPYLAEMLDCGTRQVAAWITAGAPGPGEPVP